MRKSDILDVIFPLYSATKNYGALRKDYEAKLKAKSKDIAELIADARARNLDANFTHKMADEVYDIELQRKSTLDVKATALLGASGIAASLVSINLTDIADISLKLVISLLFIISISNFVVVGIASVFVLWLRSYHIRTIGDVLTRMRSADDTTTSKMIWAIEKIVETKINSNMLDALQPWIYFAQAHFMQGVILFAAGYLLIYVYQVGNDSVEVFQRSNISPQEIVQDDLHEAGINISENISVDLVTNVIESQTEN